jgi:hypothetical protein
MQHEFLSEDMIKRYMGTIVYQLLVDYNYHEVRNKYALLKIAALSYKLPSRESCVNLLWLAPASRHTRARRNKSNSDSEK